MTDPIRYPVYLQPALPVEPRDYLAFWRAPRYRWWKSLLAILMGAVLFFMLASFFGVIGLMADRTDFTQIAATGQFVVGPGVFIANNLSLALCIPVGMLSAWACVQQRPGWLSSVAGGLRWRWLFFAMAVLLPLWISLMAITWVLSPPEGVGIWPHTVPMIVGILLTTPFQAAGEEYLVRGLFGRAVASWFRKPVVGFVISAIVTALIFMFMHAAEDPWLNVYYFTFGIVGSVLTWRTGGLEAAIAIHVVNNMLSEALLPFVDMGRMFDRGYGTGDPTVLINVAVMLVGAAALVYLAGRRKLLVSNAPGSWPQPAPGW